MEQHFKFSDTVFTQNFENCELNPSDFTHTAHLRLAWIYIRKYGISIAEQRMMFQLQKFVRFAGAEHKYNMTLTLASVKAVYHFMQRSTTTNFKDFISEFPKLRNDFKGLIRSHYGFDIFHCPKAKSSFVAPDLLPFD